MLLETRTLNQAVKRNLQRFPGDFMFQMASEELGLFRICWGNDNPGLNLGGKQYRQWYRAD